MSDPETDDESEELSQEPSGPRLSVWAPILLTAVAIGGLVWWIQSDDGSGGRVRATVEATGVTTEIALPAAPATGGQPPAAETEVAIVPAAAAPAAETTVAADTAVEAPIIIAPPTDAAPAVVTDPAPPAITAAAPPAAAAPAAVPAVPTADVPAAMTVSPAAAPPTVAASDALTAQAQEPMVLLPSAGLPTAAVSDAPAATRVDAGGIDSARVSAPPAALPIQPPPSPEPVAALTAEAPTEAAAAPPSVSTRSSPPAEPMPTVRVSAPAEIAAAPPAVPAEPGMAVLPVHRMPIVQPSEASDDADIKSTQLTAGAEVVVKAEDVVPAETVAPVAIQRDDADAPTASVTAPQPPIGTSDAGAPVLAEASRTNNAGSAPAAPPTDVSLGSPNVGDAKATDAGVIVAETLDPATLGIIEPPEAERDLPPTADGRGAPPTADAGAPGEGEPPDEPGTIVAEDVDPASLGLTSDAGDATASAAAAEETTITGVPVVAALPPGAAIVAETLDLSALVDSAAAPPAAAAPIADAPIADAPSPAAGSGEGSLPMVAAVAAIEPPRPAWQRFATTVVDAAGGRPTVSVIVDGLGQSVSRTRMAIDMLPQAVALAFDPYATAVAELAAAAQASGHEVLMTLPMEPARGSVDAGPEALGVGLTAEENADRLAWVLDRARGYVGVLAPAGAELTGDDSGMAPIVESLRRQGLMVVAGGPAALPGAIPADLPQAGVDQRIDLPDDTGLYDAAFAAAEDKARTGGHVVIMVSPYPSAMRGVAAWLATLPGKGLALAPVTAAATGSQAAAGP